MYKRRNEEETRNDRKKVRGTGIHIYRYIRNSRRRWNPTGAAMAEERQSEARRCMSGSARRDLGDVVNTPKESSGAAVLLFPLLEGSQVVLPLHPPVVFRKLLGLVSVAVSGGSW